MKGFSTVANEIVGFSASLLGWHTESHGTMGYVSITGDIADAISGHELMRRMELGKRRGFGSVKVSVRVGDSTWATSVFPQDGNWFLPIKKAIMRAEELEEGDPVNVELELL